MNLKRILCNTILFILIFSMVTSYLVFAAEEPTTTQINTSNITKIEEFKGKRVVTILADTSNMNNYLNGGRASFDYLIRKNKIEWLDIELFTDNLTLNIQLSFDFESYDDYFNKISELLGYTPVIIYDNGNYIESFSTKDFVNFLVDDMQAENMYLEDTENIEILVSGDSRIEFSNGLKIEAKNDRINYQENEEIALKLKSLKIDTSFHKEQSVFDRTIEFEIETESDALLNSMKKSFINRCKKEKVEYKNDETKKFVVNFSRGSEKELSSTTMVLLNIGTSIVTKEQYGSANKLEVIFSEYLDLEDILTENAQFLYTFDTSNFEKVKLIDGYNEDSGFTLEEKIVKVNEPQSIIKFSYQKDFEFDKIEIITDFTNDWHITMRARTLIAKNIHDKIKDSLVNAIPNGTTFNIYDEGAYRYYDIVFTGNVDKINSFTSKITDGDSELKVSQMLLPFMPSQVEDEVHVVQICTYVKNYSHIEQKYIFRKDTKLPDEEDLVVFKTDKGTTVQFENEKVSITYKNFSKILFAKFVILVIIVIVVIFIMRKKMKEKKAAKAQADKDSKVKKEKKKKKGEKSGE